MTPAGKGVVRYLVRTAIKLISYLKNIFKEEET